MLKKTITCTLLLIGYTFWSQDIHYNQVAFSPKSLKNITVKNLENNQTDFEIIDSKTKKVVLNGKMSNPKYWEQSGETLSIIDFSNLKKEGNYQLKIGDKIFPNFQISKTAYQDILKASCKAYYLNRASMEISSKYAGIYAREAGHPDDSVLIHSSAADSKRPENTVISSPGGWYDAGDYNKYIVNSGISTYTLLQAYDNYQKLHDKLDYNILESKNGNADLLNEIEYNLNWMLTMQDPNDGGVYHKLTDKKFSGFVQPKEAVTPRYVVMKSTAATLDFAAVLARYARVISKNDCSLEILRLAEEAYVWAEKNPNVLYRQPSDVFTGTYADDNIEDEWFWAKAELYIATGNEKYNTFGDDFNIGSEASWAYVKPLALFTLAENKNIHQSKAQEILKKYADQLVENYKNSPNGTVMGNSKKEFIWGSNAVAANQSMLLIETNKHFANKEYLNAAWSNINYLLGQNPLDYCYVTGFGSNPVMHPHHRISASDGIDAPQPGLLAGGPNFEQQDKNQKINYPSELPALSYTDETDSYASNEIAINWNAPLVYVLSFAASTK